MPSTICEDCMRIGDKADSEHGLLNSSYDYRLKYSVVDLLASASDGCPCCQFFLDHSGLRYEKTNTSCSREQIRLTLDKSSLQRASWQGSEPPTSYCLKLRWSGGESGPIEPCVAPGESIAYQGDVVPYVIQMEYFDMKKESLDVLSPRTVVQSPA
jgi:hypothetical protein